MPVALMNDLSAVLLRHGVRRRAIHVFCCYYQAKTWVPTSVGMTVRGIVAIKVRRSVDGAAADDRPSFQVARASFGDLAAFALGLPGRWAWRVSD